MLLHSEKPEYMRAQARPFYRRACLAHKGKTTPTPAGDPAWDIYDWAILAPGSDAVAKGADGKELRFTISHPKELAALNAMVVALNSAPPEAPHEKPAKKGA